MLVCFRRRPKGPGGDILDRGGSGGMCPPSTSVEDFAAKSVRPCHMESGVHYRYSEGSSKTSKPCRHRVGRFNSMHKGAHAHVLGMIVQQGVSQD